MGREEKAVSCAEAPDDRGCSDVAVVTPGRRDSSANRRVALDGGVTTAKTAAESL
jgi:hypothetical protein